MTDSRRRAAAAAGLLAIGFTAACGQIALPLSPSQPVGGASASNASAASRSNATPTAAPRGAPATRQVAVTRDSITETLALDGLVAAQDPVPIVSPTRAIVADVKVKVGDAVKQGDDLLTLQAPRGVQPEDVSRALDAARAKLQASQAALAQATDQAASRQQAAAARSQANGELQQQALADAQSGLRRAQDNLATVRAGASAAERQAARSAVDAAQAALQAAQDARGKAADGPDDATVRAATRDVTNAQIAVSRAQADLDALIAGPDPTAVRTAQTQLQRSQTQLQIAQAAKPDPKLDASIARLQRDQAVQDAQLAADTAQAALVKLKLPPSDSDVQVARQRVQDAQDTLDATTSRLDTVNAGPDQKTVAGAQAVVAKAQGDVAAAQARLADVNARPTASQLSDAQDQVRKAQTAVDTASLSPQPVGDLNPVDLGALQVGVDQDQAAVNTLQDTLEATRLPSPVDGTVTAVLVKAGQSITSTKPVLVVARPGVPIVHVELADDEAARLAVGQQGSVQLSTDSASGPLFPATVAVFTPASADGSRGASADLQVSWPDGQAPNYGLSVQVRLELQQKQGVLVVPVAAIHTSGSKSMVEVLSGTLRKLVSVQVGIRSDTSVEIVSGLNEGQMVMVGTL